MIILSDELRWVSKETGMQILEYIYQNPTWWLSAGIAFKYVDIRMDSRTGSMLITANRNYIGAIPKIFIIGVENA